MEIPVDTSVTAVVVYPDRARVSTRGHCDLTEGIHQIVVGELPLVLEPDSVRASGAGTARVRLRSVDVIRRHYAQAPAPKVTDLEKRIEKLRDELKVLGDRQEVNQASIDHLNGLRGATNEYAWGLARGRTTVENQSALMRFFEVEEARLREDLRGLDDEQRGLNDELAKLQAELDQIVSARPRQRYEARLDVEVLAAGNFDVEVNYIVGRAGWRPLYDMRLADTNAVRANGPVVTITSLAEITQNTGQDWRSVSLSVSTARPALNQRAPELNPWFIDVVQIQPRMARAYAKSSGAQPEMLESAAADMAAPMMAAMAPLPAPAEVEVAEAQNLGTAITFAVSGGVDIPGDGTPHKTTLGQYDLPPQLDYLSIPRHTDAVFRRAKLNNTTGAPLLAGAVNLYVGDEYIGQNRMDYTATGAEIELVLGVEERITVKRELVKREVDKRLLRDNRQVAYGYEITVENLLQSPAIVSVQDQYPVSRHDQIKVRLDMASPEPVEQTELHILKWEINLAPAEKKKIRFEYQVEHPRALNVAGLMD